MKTKIVSILLAAIILLGESSCFLRIGGRKHGAAVGVGVIKFPVENQQEKTAAVPIDSLKNTDIVTSAHK